MDSVHRQGAGVHRQGAGPQPAHVADREDARARIYGLAGPAAPRLRPAAAPGTHISKTPGR